MSRQFKIGLSAVAAQADVFGFMWNNGMTQNLVYLGLLLQRLRCVAEVCIVPIPDDGQVHQPSQLFGFKQLSLSAAVTELDVLIEVGMRIPIGSAEPFQKRGGKLVSYVAGNSFVMNLEAIASNLNDRAEVLLPLEFDASWITPQHWRTNRSYSQLTKSRNTQQISQIWDPIVLRQGISRIQHNFFYKRRLKKGCSIGVFEPNINVVKTFHLPVLICEKLYRQTPQAINHVFASNTLHLKENQHFTEFFASLDLLKANVVTSESRFPVFELLGQHVDTVVVHHWENGLNYLYYDVLYGGYPLIHNSEFLKDVGYYYDSFDVDSGAAALKLAWETHDENFDHYQARSAELLWTVSPDNPVLQKQHADLIESLFS